MVNPKEVRTMASRKSTSGSSVVRNSASGRYLVKTEAARARVVLDQKLGKKTPAEIVKLSQRSLTKGA
jgi:hypothetical protein